MKITILIVRMIILKIIQIINVIVYKRPCITNIIKGIFELISEIVKGKLKLKSYSNVANQYIKYNKIDPTINNKRICKTPFKKWYIKGYTHK